MGYSSYEEIYEIVKTYGPVSIHGISKVLQDRCRLTDKDWRYDAHCEIAGYLGGLSRRGLIKNVSMDKQGLSKIPAKKIWLAT